MNRLADFLKSLSMLSLVTLIVGTTYHPRSQSVDLSSREKKTTQNKAQVPWAVSQSKVVRPQFSMDPSVESTIHKITQAKGIPQVMNSPGYTTNPLNSCVMCQTIEKNKLVSKIRYEQCAENKNDYLESIIEKTSGENSLLGQLARLPLKQDTVIKPSCIQLSLQNTKLQYNFRSCNGNRYTSSKTIRPCGSESYVKLVSNSFDLVSKCMIDYVSPGASDDLQKQDILAAYAMLNHESSMHVNAVSDTDAGGVGQFTETAIEQINKGLSPIRSYLESHNNHQCTQLAKEFLSGSEPMKADVNQACSRISIDQGNPVKNMIYSFATLRNASRYFDESLFNDKYYSKFFALNDAQTAKLKRSLMTWSHNTGVTGLLTPARTLLTREYSGSKKVKDVDVFLEQLKNYSISHPHKKWKPRRLKEMAFYFTNIQRDISGIQENVGGSCLN